MKKIYLSFLALALLFSVAHAQSASEYNFANRTNVKLEDLNATSFSVPEGYDDATSEIYNLPFTFTFANTAYNQI